MTLEQINHPLIVSCLDESIETLQHRFKEVGYLHFKSAISKTSCQSVLNDFLIQLKTHIVWDEKSRAPQLVGQPFTETDDVWDTLYPDMQSQESFHRFFHQESVTNMMQKVIGGDIFAYPMKMARVSTPQKLGFETPPHQDAHSHQSGPTMAGLWVALHDIQEGMGRLKLLPYSHRQGVRKVHQAEGVGGVQCEIFEHENAWHVSDVEQGDVIIFDSCCIHKAEANTTEKTCRMSIDTRFCQYGEPVFITNIEPHHGWRIEALNWERIYQHWHSKDLQYYWQDYPEIFSVMKRA